MRKTLFLVVFGLLVTSLAWAGIDDAKAIHALLGEARGEGYRGMYAVACAIRNRGTLQGVYGANADISDTSEITRDAAITAWHLSKNGEDITNGADSWENTKDFGWPNWAKGHKPTAIIGNHSFFKIKKGGK